MEAYPAVKKVLITDYLGDPRVKSALDWYDRAIDYSTRGGKMFRGLTVVVTSKILLDAVGKDEASLTPAQRQVIERARIVGWGIELLQASFLVLDDIMDASPMRRGQPTWYKAVKKMFGYPEMNAINDGLYLEHTPYTLLDDMFKGRPEDEQLHNDLVRLFEETTRYTIVGQQMDILCLTRDPNVNGGVTNLSIFDKGRLESIHEYKTAYYTISFSFRSVLYLTGRRDRAVHEAVEGISKVIGVWFQVQDDFLDCYGDPAVTGKVGTDIRDGKVTWLAVTLLQKPATTTEQRIRFMVDYGKGEDATAEANIKRIYDEVDMQAAYRAYEEETYKKLMVDIGKVVRQFGLPANFFDPYMSKLYKRDK